MEQLAFGLLPVRHVFQSGEPETVWARHVTPRWLIHKDGWGGAGGFTWEWWEVRGPL